MNTKIEKIADILLNKLVKMNIGDETTIGIMLHEAGYDELDDITIMRIMDNLDSKAKELGTHMDYSANENNLSGLQHNLSFIKRLGLPEYSDNTEFCNTDGKFFDEMRKAERKILAEIDPDALALLDEENN